MRIALVLPMLLLAGCPSLPVEYVPYPVNVPVPVPCAVAVPPAPARETERLRKADPGDEKVKAILADLQKQESYIEKLKAATDGCR